MAQVSGSGFETLWNDGEFLLLRNLNVTSFGPVLMVVPAVDQPTPTSVDRLRHAYEIKNELDPGWAARPIDFVDFGAHRALLIEDHGGDLLARLVGKPWEVEQFLRVALGITAVVGRLHQRGFVHKDIKPANIFVDIKTGEARLSGFGLVSRISRERQALQAPESIAGTLAYMAPEQTGRMNRSVDSRSDLYSLGVACYEMLTGKLPFMASDAMGWIHSHIAKQAVAPSAQRKDIPSAISSMILKLLAKNAEDRYQTAAGFEADLQNCLEQWVSHGGIDPFPLGTRDVPNRLLVAEKLYGRENEVATLLASFDRVVKGGTPELVLVSGYSGIGKSSVVSELHKTLVPMRGIFASGKFDQYKRDIPYSTMAQAFQGLIRFLLAKSEAELSDWRASLLDALGINAGLMSDLIPELRLITGDPPPIPEVEPQQAQRRFQYVIRRFIGVFAKPEHPLVLFLDDLQWLDGATLDLLEDLLIQPDAQHLMLIGAYRDNEVDALHPLMRKLSAIKEAGARVQEIKLSPLSCGDIELLLSDALHCPHEDGVPLAHLINEKTAGNPFFVIQFLYSLSEEGLLRLDQDSACWRWDLSRIQGKAYTDNVVDLMVVKLTRLPDETQAALQQLACLGNSAATSTISNALATSEEQVHATLWPAVRQELIERFEGSYRFVHDRVQEAVYSLIPEALRAEAHLRIGRLLTAQTSSEEWEQASFEIVNQLNLGVALMTSREELEQLAKFNLAAGKRAQASAAYASALKYLSAGAALLPEDSWLRVHDLAFALELGRAQCEFVSGAVADAEERLARLSTRAVTIAERTIVACLRVDLYIVIDRSESAVATGLDHLRHLGIDWPARPTEEDARREYERIWSLLDGRTVESLVDLPSMSDSASVATLEILIRVAVPAFFASSHLFALAVCRAVNLSLERGNGDASCIAYGTLAMLAGPHFGNYKAGFQFGSLGCELVKAPGLARFEARAYEIFGFVIPWTRHVRAGRDLLVRALEIANRVGDVTHVGYAGAQINTNILMAGDPLVVAQREAESGLDFAKKAQFGLIVGWILGQLGLIRTLRGLTTKFGSFNCEDFDEHEFEHHLSSSSALALPECWYWIRKLQARFLAGDHAAAIDASFRAQAKLWTSLSMLEVAEYHFYSALCRAALCESAAVDERRQHLDALDAHRQHLDTWAENCPENFANRALLVDGEIARLEGRALDAEHLYEEAIRSARAHGFLQNEALANELASRFYTARGFEKIGRLYLQDARYCYLRWGADGKVRQLDETYPYLRSEQFAPSSMSTIATSVEHLDLATVIKVSQTVSGEIVLEELIQRLMHTAIENSGAERALLVVPHGVELQVRAEAMIQGSSVNVVHADSPISSNQLPEPILHYVARTSESIILEDASAPGQFSDDEYIRLSHARSILCLPLLKQGRLIALLYLENKLATNAFTPARIAVLNVLASAAASSLENSSLYRELKEREAKIRRLVDANVVGIVVLDRDLRIVEANDAFLQTIGLIRDNFTSGHLTIWDLTPPEWREVSQRAIDQLDANGTCELFEKEYLHSNGSRVPVLVAAAAIQERKTEYVAFVLDLTERKRAEGDRERLRQLQADLARINRVTTMGELTASLSHEIKQPIAAAITNANTCLRWLAREVPDIEEARDAARRTVKAATRASETINRIRSIFQKEAPEHELVDINEMISEIVILLRNEAMEYTVTVATELASDLPCLIADRVQLQQVFMNLMINGIEAMKSVENTRRLTLSSKRDGPDQVLVSVADTGVGLPPEVDQIFNAFFTTKANGTGMGLAISRSIVESHGGRLWATSNSTHGATFHITLPTTEERA